MLFKFCIFYSMVLKFIDLELNKLIFIVLKLKKKRKYVFIKKL